MNHRGVISGIDLNRKILPEEYHYKNWNLGAVKGNLTISPDSILVYGNIGIWSTNSQFANYNDLNAGLPPGTDNRKVFDLHQTSNGNLYAATLFGLFAFDKETGRWRKFFLDTDIDRFVGLESKGDTLYAINRSFLFIGYSDGVATHFQKTELPKPNNYRNEISLFQTVWQIHSGEIFGVPGKLFVDILGFITLFISITGVIYFLFPKWIKRRKRRRKSVNLLARINRWSLTWHNKLGAWLFVFLLILFATGMFLRPPLLISIAGSKTAPIRYTHLDQPNPWYDKLRDLHYDKERGKFLLATSDGLFYVEEWDKAPVKFSNQPPVSVMGITVLEPYEKGAYLIGSFSGLFLWHPGSSQVYNFPEGRIHHKKSGGRPVGEHKITGLINDSEGRQYFVDYDEGVQALHHDGVFPGMPEKIKSRARMSLWNLALEFHTGRIFQGILHDFYILLVPLTGLAAIIVVLSGYLYYRKKFKKRRPGKTPKNT